MENKRTFFVSSEELQLFLLLPPQRVDDGDGQPESFLRVTVGPEGVDPGAGCGDVLCEAARPLDILPVTSSSLDPSALFSPCHSGHPRVSNRELSKLPR